VAGDDCSSASGGIVEDEVAAGGVIKDESALLQETDDLARFDGGNFGILAPLQLYNVGG
jgi:hypothetical protein